MKVKRVYMKIVLKELPPPRSDAQVLSWVLCLCDAVIAAQHKKRTHCNLTLSNIYWDERHHEPCLADCPPVNENEDPVYALALLARTWLTPEGATREPWRTILAIACLEDSTQRYSSVSHFATTLRNAFMPSHLRSRWIWFIVLSILAWILIPLGALGWKYWVAE